MDSETPPPKTGTGLFRLWVIELFDLSDGITLFLHIRTDSDVLAEYQIDSVA